MRLFNLPICEAIASRSQRVAFGRHSVRPGSVTPVAGDSPVASRAVSPSETAGTEPADLCRGVCTSDV